METKSLAKTYPDAQMMGQAQRWSGGCLKHDTTAYICLFTVVLRIHINSIYTK